MYNFYVFFCKCILNFSRIFDQVCNIANKLIRRERFAIVEYLYCALEDHRLSVIGEDTWSLYVEVFRALKHMMGYLIYFWRQEWGLTPHCPTLLAASFLGVDRRFSAIAQEGSLSVAFLNLNNITGPKP
jgi:hypothetical protein